MLKNLKMLINVSKRIFLYTEWHSKIKILILNYPLDGGRNWEDGGRNEKIVGIDCKIFWGGKRSQNKIRLRKQRNWEEAANIIKWSFVKGIRGEFEICKCSEIPKSVENKFFDFIRGYFYKKYIKFHVMNIGAWFLYKFYLTKIYVCNNFIYLFIYLVETLVCVNTLGLIATIAISYGP